MTGTLRTRGAVGHYSAHHFRADSLPAFSRWEALAREACLGMTAAAAIYPCGGATEAEPDGTPRKYGWSGARGIGSMATRACRARCWDRVERCRGRCVTPVTIAPSLVVVQVPTSQQTPRDTRHNSTTHKYQCSRQKWYTLYRRDSLALCPCRDPKPSRHLPVVCPGLTPPVVCLLGWS